jgi:hypothetical protein
MAHPKTIVLKILTLLSLAIPSAAAGPHRIISALDPPLPDRPPPVVGHNGGQVFDITVRGEYAYLSIGSELAILNVAEPTHPVRVGHVTLPGDFVGGPAIAGNYAYLMNRNHVLVIDIAQPRAPSIVASLPVETYNGQLVVVGHYLYLIGFGVLRIIDIAMPLAPIEVGAMPFDAYGMQVVGSYAYVGVGSHDDLGPGIQVLNISNPVAPILLGTYRTAPPPSGIHYDVSRLAIENGHAYLIFAQCSSCPSEKAEIVDLANPSAPQHVGDLPSGPTDMTVAGKYAYMAEKNVLRVIDISHPAAPLQIAAYPTGPKGLYFPPLIAIQGHYVYYAAEDGLTIVDVSNPADPRTVGSYSQIIYADGVAVAGRYAYVAAGFAGMAVLDIADPTNPTLVGRLAFSTWENILAVSGHYIYLYSWITGPPIGGTQRLLVVNVADPATPTLVGSLVLAGPNSIPGRDVALAVVGSYVYLASPDGLKIVDATNPSIPKVVGTLPFNITDLVVSGHYAYLADQTRGLVVVDIANPAHPTQVGMLPLTYVPRLALAGRYVYAGDGLQLMVIDVANSAAPQLVGQLAGPSGDLTVDGRYVYFVNKSVFQAVDVSNPAAPVDAGTYLLGNGGQADLYSSLVAAAGGYAYVAGGNRGLAVIRLGRSISGRVTHANGLPTALAGVTISASVGLTATTDLSGTYLLNDISGGSHILTPALAGYGFWPASRSVTISSNALGQDFVALTGPVSATLTPSAPAGLTSVDTQGLPTQLDLPAGAVAANTTLVFTPTIVERPRGLAFAGHAFNLAASQSGTTAPDLLLSAPATVTISYSVGDVRLVSNQASLALWWWNGSGWQDASATCNPAVATTRDPASKTISVAICRTGRFALYGPTQQVYLPL